MNTTATVIYASGIFNTGNFYFVESLFFRLLIFFMMLRHNSWKISQAHVINDALRKTLILLFLNNFIIISFRVFLHYQEIIL